jgi:hypothetical protein
MFREIRVPLRFHMNILRIISTLQDALSLIEAISFRQLILYIDITTHLRPLLEHKGGSPNPYIHPLWLEIPVVNFLVDAISSVGETIASKQVKMLSDIMSQYIWDPVYRPASKALLPFFLEYDTQHKIGRLRAHMSHFPSRYSIVLTAPGLISRE